MKSSGHADQRKLKRTSRLSIAISVALHAIIVGVLIFWAAREGILGTQLRKLAVTMVPPEKPPEPPKEKPPEPKPEPTPPKENTPPPVQSAQPEIARSAPAPPDESLAPAAAPAPAALPAFDFEGGKTVESSSDPLVLYKSYLEYTLHSHWNRPDGIADFDYVVEIELEVSPEGRILGYEWKKGLGDRNWDDSVRQAIAQTPALDRPPPKGFPEKVLVRFDVQTEQETDAQ